MKSYSQAGQDRFVWEILNHKNDGIFLDVGCNDGHKHSNSLGLEELGWRGLLVDIQSLPRLYDRLNYILIRDAVTLNWKQELDWILPGAFIDYLSLDVDDATTATLANLLDQFGCPFRVITIEHDLYRNGPKAQIDQITLLSAKGMQLMCKNVCVGHGDWGKGGPFEDWWVCKDLMTEDNCRRFLCDNQLGTSIVPE